MKSYIFITLLFYFSSPAFSQQNVSDSGFTNITEAQNQKIKGKKEGKWIEYEDDNGNFARKENASSYVLVAYIEGKESGLVRKYSTDGSLLSKVSYSNGKINGLYVYYSSKKIIREIPYKNGQIDGVEKDYYDTGILSTETPYSKGKIDGTEKVYSENGKIQREIEYKKGEMEWQTYYDKNGNKI